MSISPSIFNPAWQEPFSVDESVYVKNIKNLFQVLQFFTRCSGGSSSYLIQSRHVSSVDFIAGPECQYLSSILIRHGKSFSVDINA